MSTESVPKEREKVIGITYDLREDYENLDLSEEELAEFDSPQTIASIENVLSDLGYKTEKIGNLKNLVHYLSLGKRWDLVFNIAEGLYGFGREAQIPAILDAYKIPYTFSDPLTLSIALHKGRAKEIILNHNIPTPPFFIIEEIKDLIEIDSYLKNFKFPLFVKPVAGGTSIGVNSNSKVLNKEMLIDRIKNILNKYKQPAIVEKYLPGREFTVGILGNSDDAHILGAIEIIFEDGSEKGVYSYYNKENCEKVIKYIPASDKTAFLASEIALKVHKILNCKDSSRVDIRVDENGVPNFIEINPLAGLHPTHSDLPIIASTFGIDYKNLIKNIVNSAFERAKIYEKIKIIVK